MAIEKITGFTPIGETSFQKIEGFVPLIPEGEGIPSYLEQVIQNWDKRVAQVNKTAEDYSQGELDGTTGFRPLDYAIGAFQKNTQVTGKLIAGTAMDTVGVGIGMAMDGISWAIPDVVEEPVKNALSSSFSWVMDTKAGKEAQEAFNGGVEVYGKYKKKNPQLAKTFESVVNIGVMFTPYKAKVGPVQGAPIVAIGPPQMQKIGSKIIYGTSSAALRTGAAKETASNFVKLERLLSPPLDKKNTKKLGPEGQSLIVPSTLLKRPSMQATASETEVIEHLLKMKKIKPGSGASYNKQVIDINQQKLNNEVSIILQQYSKGVNKLEIKPFSVSKNIDDSIAEMIAKQTTLKGDEAVNDLILKYKNATKEILTKADDTPQGIHKARVEFDALINTEIGAKVLTSEGAGFTSEIAKAIRNGMNKSIDDVIPVSNSVSAKRQLQNYNYRAIDMLAIKIPMEGPKLLSLFQNLNRVNKTRASASSASVLLGIQMASPAMMHTIAGIAGTVAIAATGPLLFKGFTSPTTRKALGVTLREIDRALAITKNNAMLKQLKLDRVMISDWLSLMSSEKEQKQ
tara:strand:+ start:444 stop:2156 length:1713 start_codon:yes stop_codon:yes gene_type:complete